MSDLGDTLAFRSDVYDTNGALANASSVTLTVTLPDGSTTTPTVTNPPAVTGKYAYDYVTTVGGLSGRYVGQWLFTFAGGATTSYVQAFDVGRSMITVDEAIKHLRATGTIVKESDREQLDWLCQVATDAVERDLGRIMVRRSVTEKHDGGRAVICLRSGPVISVTLVAENGVTLSASDYYASVGDILYRSSTYGSRLFGYGQQNIEVTYVAGYLEPPRIARKVALNTVQGMWQSSQQASHPLLDEDAESFISDVVGGLNPLETRAFDSLRAPGIA